MHSVTFTADYFVITTTVQMEGSPDALYSDIAISYKANKFLERQYGFSPMEYAYDIEVKDVSL